MNLCVNDLLLRPPMCKLSTRSTKFLAKYPCTPDALNHYINLELTNPRKHYRQSIMIFRQVQDSKIHHFLSTLLKPFSPSKICRGLRLLSGKCITSPVTLEYFIFFGHVALSRLKSSRRRRNIFSTS